MTIELAALAASFLFASVDMALDDGSYALEPGWKWVIEPVQLAEGWHEGAGWRGEGGDAVLRVRYDDGLDVQLRFPPPQEDCRSSRPEYRPILMRPDGSTLRRDGWSEHTRVERVVRTVNFAGVDGPQDVARVGLAVLTLNGRRERARLAMQRADEIGARVPPLPIVGEPYEFAMPQFGERVEGDEHQPELIRHEDLRGKVIVFDFWATWCGPCMDKMPALRELHKRFEPQGLVIIGINMDHDAEIAKRAIEQHELTWPHVYAPDAAKGDDALWNDITDITSLPTMFILDRKGVMREVIWPHGIAEKFEKYLNEPAEPEAQ